MFSDLVGASPASFKVATDGGDVEQVAGDYVMGQFFPALGVQPVIGRLIEPSDDRLGTGDPAVAVVSWSVRETRWHLSPAIIGSRLMVEGVAATVIGVTPRGFSGLVPGRSPRLWVPSAMEPLVQRPSQRVTGQLGLMLVGRLAPGVTIEQARAEMRLLDRAAWEEFGTRIRGGAWPRSTCSPLGPDCRCCAIRWVADAGADGDRRGAAADCVHQRRQHAARQSHRTPARDGGAGRARSWTAASPAAVAHRVAPAGGRGWRHRRVARLERRWSAGADLAARSAHPRAGSRYRSISISRVLLFTAAIVVGTAILFGLAPAWDAFAQNGSPALRQSRRHGRDAVAAAVRQDPGRGAGGALGRAAERRRTVHGARCWPCATGISDSTGSPCC